MTNAKKSTISLTCNGLGNRSFSFEHAERLLRMRNNGGWMLPKDSPYEFINNGITRRADKKGNKGTKETGNNPQGYCPSEPD